MNDIFQRRLRLPLIEQEMLLRRLAMLLAGGVPLVEALRMLERQSASPTMAAIAAAAANDTERGRTLAASLSERSGVFDSLTLALVEIGERSGTLEVNLRQLASDIKKRRALRRAVVSAATYPAFVLLATLGIAIFLAAYVFPKIVPVFRSLDAALPPTTRFMIGVSDLLLNHPWLLLLSVGLLVVVAATALRRPRVRLALDRAVIRLPVFGALARGQSVANHCRAFGLLLGSGEPAVEAARLSAVAVGNQAYTQVISTFAPAVAAGGSVSDCYRSAPSLFPPIVPQLLEAGERTGNLQETFLFLATIHEEEVDELAKGLGPALEPILLIVMGAVVGFVALSIITPIYALTSRLGS